MGKPSMMTTDEAREMVAAGRVQFAADGCGIVADGRRVLATGVSLLLAQELRKLIARLPS